MKGCKLGECCVANQSGGLGCRWDASKHLPFVGAGTGVLEKVLVALRNEVSSQTGRFDVVVVCLFYGLHTWSARGCGRGGLGSKFGGMGRVRVLGLAQRGCEEAATGTHVHGRRVGVTHLARMPQPSESDRSFTDASRLVAGSVVV